MNRDQRRQAGPERPASDLMVTRYAGGARVLVGFRGSGYVGLLPGAARQLAFDLLGYAAQDDLAALDTELNEFLERVHEWDDDGPPQG